jgi:hypothetical protein
MRAAGIGVGVGVGVAVGRGVGVVVGVAVGLGVAVGPRKGRVEFRLQAMAASASASRGSRERVFMAKTIIEGQVDVNGGMPAARGGGLYTQVVRSRMRIRSRKLK